MKYVFYKIHWNIGSMLDDLVVVECESEDEAKFVKSNICERYSNLKLATSVCINIIDYLSEKPTIFLSYENTPAYFLN